MGLTVKQRAFAEYYLELGNATEAYKRAGYRCSGDNIAGVEGHKLLKNTKIGAYIEELQKEISSKRIATATEVLEYLTKVVRGQETEEVIATKGVGDGYSEVVKVDKEIAAKDRVKAAELLGKRYALFTDKQQIDAEVVIFKNEDKLED